MHLQCLPIKNYGCVGYVDDCLLNTVFIAPMALYSEFSCIIRFFLHFMAILCTPLVLYCVFQTIVFFSFFQASVHTKQKKSCACVLNILKQS